jgi:predicted TIM-barrel fold metal-dependent hydrolase
MYGDDLLLPWHQALRELVPGMDLFDAHTHTGSNDPDGMTCSASQLIDGLELAGARAVTFTMHEPDGYREANDRVIDEAEASGGRLVPFCRVDPADDPLAEAERALARGARGIKLHPRAEGFLLGDPRLERMFAMADERGLAVITHAGRGIPALGRDALDIAARHPGVKLILAHDGVCDLGWIWRHAADHPNLLFDSAWWSTLDHLTLFSLVPPGQILFASDMPYGTTLLASILSLRTAFQAGLSADQVREIAGGQIQRILDGQEPLDLGPAPGDGRLTTDLLLSRVHSYLVTATGRMMISDDAPDYVGLARLACEVGDDAPQAAACASVLALLDRGDAYVAREAQEPTRPPAAGPGQLRPHPAVGMVIVAAAVSLTPDVPLPDVPADVDVAERAR